MRKQMTVAMLALAVVVMSIAATGCMSTVSPGRQVADAEITSAVKAKFAADPDVAAINIDVDTLEGVVTLNGRVKTSDEKSKAGSIARDVNGVKNVVNNLRIGDNS